MAGGVPAGWVRLICTDPKIDATMLLGEEPPQVTNGVGGWEVVQRPRQVAMTIWQGVEPFTLALSVVLDGFRSGLSQEPVIRDLLTAGRGDAESEPSVFEVRGIPSLPADEWVLNDVEPGDEVIRRDDFDRTRQSYTLTFLEYVPPTFVQLRAKARQGAKAKTTLYTVKRGETPALIARKRRCKWTDLRQLNQSVVKSANQTTLKAGTRIRVPVLKKAVKATKR
jgi:LysM domain